MAFFCIILFSFFINTQAIDLNDNIKLEQLLTKLCEKYVNQKIKGIQDKHDAEIATLKLELAKSTVEMGVMKTEFEQQRKEIVTLTAKIAHLNKPKYLSDSSSEALTANIDQSKRPEHFLDSSTETPTTNISQSNRPEHHSDSAADGRIGSGKTLTRRVGSKVVETRNNEGQQALPSNEVRIRRDVLRIAFFAYLTSHSEHLGQGQDIVFDHVVTNIGNAYNGNHGVFVAPVHGTYVFSCTLLSQYSATTWGHFVVNRNIIAKFSLTPAQQASQTVVVTLNAGDDVSIQNTYADRSITGDIYSTFSGFLLIGSESEEITG